MVVGTSPQRGSVRARPLAVRGLLLLACLLAAAALHSAPAGALVLGISDSDDATVTEPFWSGLGIDRARVVVPYDIATTAGAAGAARRDRFERYRAAAAAAGVSLLVVFAPSDDVRAPDTGDPLAPSADEFAAAFAAFRVRYPELTTIAPWNEPNNRDTSAYALGSTPQLAADYFVRAQTICGGACTLVAGDFAGIAGDDAYVDAYQAELQAFGVVPSVWAFHAHADVNRFQVVGVSDASISRYYLSKLQGPWAGARIWIDEVGARYRDADGLVWGDASQRDATSLLLGLATLDPRIDAIYYYNYSNQCATPGGCAVQDRGLVSPTPFDGNAPDYDAANRRRAAYAVIAARGPLIAPVAQLPPAVTIDAPAQGRALNNPTPTFRGRAASTVNSDPAVRLQLFPGAGDTVSSRAVQTLIAPVTGTSWSVTARRLVDGIYTARATQAGNPGTSGISQDVIFTVDTVAPTTTIVGGPRGVSGAHEQAIAFAASEPGVRLSCSRDGGRSAPCVSPLTLRHLKLGRHTFAVRARDAAGNLQRAPTRLSWEVVSLASALAPRLGGISATLAGGLTVPAACADRCRVTARLGLPKRGTLATADVRRRGAGAFALRLRPSGAGASALGRMRSAALKLTLVLDARNAAPVTIVRTVTLVRTGALRSLARGGLPVTLACTSACSARGGLWVARALAKQLRAQGRSIAGGRDGLPRGTRYVPLASRSATRSGPGGSDFTLALGRTPRARLARLPSAAARVTGIVSGPGSDPRALSLPLALTR